MSKDYLHCNLSTSLTIGSNSSRMLNSSTCFTFCTCWSTFNRYCKQHCKCSIYQSPVRGGTEIWEQLGESSSAIYWMNSIMKNSINSEDSLDFLFISVFNLWPQNQTTLKLYFTLFKWVLYCPLVYAMIEYLNIFLLLLFPNYR